MLYVTIGVTGFILVALYDLNQIRGKMRTGLVLSSIGYLGILASLVFVVTTTTPAAMPLGLLRLKIALALAFLALLVYSVAIEIPLAQRKREREKRNGAPVTSPAPEQPVVDTGFYGMVRHPGFIWFAMLWATIISLYHSPTVTLCGGLLIALDLLLIIVEDLVVFPRIFPAYEEYKRRVPFLIPRIRRT